MPGQEGGRKIGNISLESCSQILGETRKIKNLVRTGKMCKVESTRVRSSFPLKQRSPTFLTPGTGFMEDNFSTDRGMGEDGYRMSQAHYICCALYYYYIVIYNEIIIQLTIRQNQCES